MTKIKRKHLVEGSKPDVSKEVKSAMPGLREMYNSFKKLKELQKKNSSYSNIPIDHPDVDAQKEIRDREFGIKYPEKEIIFKNETGLDGPKMGKERAKAKKFMDSVQGSGARKRTATEGSFKKGGFVRGQGLAMRGGGCAMKGKKRR